jgi:hypothetical protein
MKASELRIGNLLEFSNGIQPTKLITVGRRFFSSASIEKEDGDFEITGYYKPVPITEEFLKQFGFNQLNGSYWERNGVGFIVGYAVDGSMVVGNSFGARHCHYYYVHQIQNIWHSVTGEELYLA